MTGVKRTLWCMVAAGSAALSGAAWSQSSPSVGGAAKTPEQSASANGATKDVLTFKNGRVIEGRIVEITETEVKVEVTHAGLKAVTSFPRADILSIERGVSAEGKPAEAGVKTPAAGAAEKDGKKASAQASPGAAKVYQITLKGNFGRDVSLTPIKRALEDAMSMDPDVIVVKMDCTQDERFGFDGLFAAERMLPPFEEAMRGGKRVVFWIKRATVGAAFLPLVSKEIYFMPEGRMGGIGTLQNFDLGDKRVNEKQISLRLGHAEGIAIQGGYDPILVRAMARAGRWLAVNFRGGKPEYITSKPTPEQVADGWIVLTDDADGENKDTDEQVVRGTANDVLNLNADMALRLNVSKGTAEDMSKLVFTLGLGSEHTLLEGKGQKILDDWAKSVKDAGDEMRRLQSRLQSFAQKQGEDPKTALGRRSTILRELRGLLGTYEEVFDAGGEQRARIDQELEQIRQQIAEINRQQRQPRR